MALIDPFSAGWIFEKTLFGTTKVLSIGYKGPKWIWYDIIDQMFHAFFRLTNQMFKKSMH